MIVAFCVPSSRSSSTASMSKLTDAWLAGMVTLEGIPMAAALLLANATVNAAPLSVLLRLTVAVVAATPAFSAIEATAIATVSVSWSVTSSESLPDT